MPSHAKRPASMKCIHGGPPCELCHGGSYADGGDVSKGFNGALGSAGIQSSIKNLTGKPKMMADGGEMDAEEHESEDGEMGDEDEMELSKVLGEELMSAIEHKDHKQMMDAIEAIVMNCMSRGGK